MISKLLARGWALASLLGFAGFSLSTQAADKMDFDRDVKPVLQMYCLPCHSFADTRVAGGYNMSTKVSAFRKYYKPPTIVPGNPGRSVFYQVLTNSPAHPVIHSLKEKSKTFSAENVEIIRRWIAAGAEWPDYIRRLVPRMSWYEYGVPRRVEE